MANFTEAGTSVVEIVSSKTIVVQQSLKLEFAPYTPRYFKLGLPYHGKVKLHFHLFKKEQRNEIETFAMWLQILFEVKF